MSGSGASRIEDEAIRQVLRDRAHLASQPAGEIQRGARPLLTFRLGPETFALEASRVREVLSGRAVCRVPGAPRVLRGVVNLRGGFVTVIDTCQMLSLPPDPMANYHLVLDGRKRPLALEVAPPLDLELPDPSAREGAERASEERLYHSTTIGGQLVGVIDPDVLLERLPRARPAHAAAWTSLERRSR
ncbi:MAG: chemotaxis protein CheW [Planctomycetota bacterium]